MNVRQKHTPERPTREELAQLLNKASKRIAELEHELAAAKRAIAPKLGGAHDSQ